MPIYNVKLPATVVHTIKENVDTMQVAAAAGADAIAAAQAYYGGTSPWSDAVATALVDTVTVNTASALIGWRFRISINDPDGSLVEEVTLTGAGTSYDTLDEIGTQLAVLLNATTSIANAAYNATTQVLTCADIADGLGDHTLTVEVLPPPRTNSAGDVLSDDVAQPGFIVAIVHEGIAGAVLTVEFPADTYVVPLVLDVGKAG